MKSGLLGIGRSGDDAQTRAYSVDGDFIWMPTNLTDKGEIAKDPVTGAERSNQRIGFCWTGINTVDPEYSAAAALTQKVYTNYEFEHVGWLDVDATGVEREECSPFALLNGGYIVGETANDDVATWNAEAYKNDKGEQGTKYQTDRDKENRRAIGTYKNGKLNLGSGLFKTENSDVFEGEYLVYFPYTDGFTKGQILATQPDHFDIDVAENRFATLSRYAFSIGRVPHYNGGQSLEKISTSTLSSFAGVRLYNTSTTTQSNNIKKVIFYANESGFLFEQDLDAKACVEAIKNDTPLNENVYYKSGTTTAKASDTNAIYATLKNDDKDYATVSSNVNKGVSTAVNVYFPVLPQTIENMTVVLIDDQDKTYVKEVETPMTFKSGANASIEIDLKDAKFENKYMVVDEATLFSAIKNIQKSGDKLAENTIQLLRNVRIENVATTYGDNVVTFDKDIRIMTKCPEEKGVGISLAAGQKMFILSQDATNEAKLTFEVPVTVEGAGCCDEDVARLAVHATSLATTNVEFTKIINHGALALANGDGEVVVNVKKELVNEFDEWAIDKKKTADAAQLFLLGENSEIEIKTLTNKGTITASPVALAVATTDWTKTVSEETGKLTEESFTDRRVVASIGTLTNTVSTGVKNANVNAGGVVNIQGFAELIVGTLNNASETAVIKTLNVVDGEANTTKDGRLTLTGASTNNGIIDNNGVTNLEAAPMENNGLLLDQLSGQLGGQYIDNGSGSGISRTYGDLEYKTDLPVKGMYVSKVATKERLNFTLTDAVASASVNVIEFVAMEGAVNLAEVDPNDVLGDKDVYVSFGDEGLVLKAFDVNTYEEVVDPTDPSKTKKVYNSIAKSFGHCVTVRSTSVLKVKDGLLSTESDVNVEKNGEFIVQSIIDGDKSEITIGGNLNNSGTAIHQGNSLTISKDLKNETDATFTSQKQFAVKGSVETAGTFDSNGTPNTVGVNFSQTAGKTTFAYKTTTTITGQFSCSAGASFLREALGVSGQYRATVNVGSLGELKGSNQGGGWPTVMRN